MTDEEMISRINLLRKEKNAIILAHYYTRPEIQDIADYVGDSLGLSKMAATTQADIIVFCGVHFMGETAAIISPEKKVLLPAPDAGCSLADGIQGEDIRKWKEQNPDGLVVSYVNTTADTKAYTDFCCTSSNAINVVKSLPKDKKILFTPDKNLGAYINMVADRKMDVWTGNCYVHERITSKMVLDMLEKYPEADVLIHPESNCSRDPQIVRHPRVFFYSTSGIIKHATESPKNTFVIATETEIIYKLKKENPNKLFVPISDNAKCVHMKKITLAKLLDCLENETGIVKVDPAIREKALLSIERMLAL